MKTIFALLLVSTMTAAATFSSLAHADEEMIALSCSEEGNTPLAGDSIKALDAAIHAMQCGQADLAYRYTVMAQNYIRKDIGPIAITARGSCYSKVNCQGDLLGTATITKDACSAANGKSWKQQTPTAGDCEAVK